MAKANSPIDWIIAPIQTNPLEILRADWHWTASNGLELSKGLVTDMTITDAFWWLANEHKDQPGRFIGTLLQDGGGEMWAGHLPK